MTKKLLAILLLVVGLPTSGAWAAFNQGDSAILGGLGFSRGGAAITLEYENGYDNTYGLGAYFRMVPDNDEPAAVGYTTLGGFIRPHFNRGNWDFSVAPGFGLIFLELPNGNDETLIGPSLQVGLLYEYSANMSFGFDVFEMWSWFGEDDYRGAIEGGLFSLKMRFIL